MTEPRVELGRDRPASTAGRGTAGLAFTLAGGALMVVGACLFLQALGIGLSESSTEDPRPYEVAFFVVLFLSGLAGLTGTVLGLQERPRSRPGIAAIILGTLVVFTGWGLLLFFGIAS